MRNALPFCTRTVAWAFLMGALVLFPATVSSEDSAELLWSVDTEG